MSAARRARQQNTRGETNDILRDRERLVAELTKLREQGHDSRFLTNAEQLLTRWWSASGWNARQQLLKSAEWLLRLEKNPGAAKPLHR